MISYNFSQKPEFNKGNLNAKPAHAVKKQKVQHAVFCIPDHYANIDIKYHLFYQALHQKQAGKLYNAAIHDRI